MCGSSMLEVFLLLVGSDRVAVDEREIGERMGEHLRPAVDARLRLRLLVADRRAPDLEVDQPRLGVQADLIEHLGVGLHDVGLRRLVVAPDRDLRPRGVRRPDQRASPREVGGLGRVSERTAARVELLVVAGHPGREERASDLQLARVEAPEGGPVDRVVDGLANARVVERRQAAVQEEPVGVGRGVPLVAVAGPLLDGRKHVRRRRVGHVVELAGEHILGLRRLLQR